MAKDLTKFDQLQEWFDELLKGYSQDLYIENTGGQGNDKEVKYFYNFYTDNYKYHIVALVREDHDYLGCQVSCRKPYAGENWHRGNDLPDGPFTKETWLRILNGIIRYEMVQVAPKQISTVNCPEINFDKAETSLDELQDPEEPGGC